MLRSFEELAFLEADVIGEERAETLERSGSFGSGRRGSLGFGDAASLGGRRGGALAFGEATSLGGRIDGSLGFGDATSLGGGSGGSIGLAGRRGVRRGGGDPHGEAGDERAQAAVLVEGALDQGGFAAGGEGGQQVLLFEGEVGLELGVEGRA